jgi:hypothetical protein
MFPSITATDSNQASSQSFVSSYFCEHNSSLWKHTLRRTLEQMDSIKARKVGKHLFKKSAGGNLRWALCFLEINLVNFHLTINELIHIYNNP